MIFSKDKSTIGEPVNESVRRNGYMALDMQSFDIRSVYFLNIKKNNIIDGFFSKIIYTHHTLSFNGVYIWVQMVSHHIVSHRDHNYSYYYLDVSEEININLLHKLASVEHSIIQYYKNLYKINKTPFYQLKNQFQMGNIKIYKNIRKYAEGEQAEPLHETTQFTAVGKACRRNCEAVKATLKISGIWETTQNIGITYKITEIMEHVSEPI